MIFNLIKLKIEEFAKYAMPVILILVLLISLCLNATKVDNPNIPRVYVNGSFLDRPIIQILTVKIASPSVLIDLSRLGYHRIVSISSCGPINTRITHFSNTEVELLTMLQPDSTAKINLTIIGN